MAIYFLLVIFMMICSFGIKSENVSMGVFQRFIANFDYKLNTLLTGTLKEKIFVSWYFIIIPIAIYTFIKKRYWTTYYWFTTLLIILFIQFTKLRVEYTDDRYLALIYSIICIPLFLMLKKQLLIQIGVSTVIVLGFGRKFLHKNYSYNTNIEKWSIEYKKMYEHKPAAIHPKHWYINNE
ncbi:MAG: hypothetical protein Q4G16_01600 [Cruoricaptor ignavus]|nr:hypothetical protein [Cruoricaptor ignavus]